MLNVQTLTNTLSRMPLPQLQQYAALHKNDPYVVSLALSIANQKKQMMTGQAGQAGMQPQPKVVDQDIAQMTATAGALPEDTGIGQLPAQNMQRMAEGGIVAFGPGGSTGEEDMPEWLKVFPPESGLRRVYRAAKEYDKNNPMPVYPTVPATAPPMAQPLPSSATQVMSGLPAVKTPPPPPPPPVAAAPKPVAPVAPTAAPVDPMVGIKALDTKSMTAAEAKKQASELTDSTELRKNLEANEKFTTNAYDKLLGDYDKKIAEMPEAYKGYEARLQKEEAEAASDKDKALGLAIFQAGLGMMSGTSQYAFENIGKGALAGLDNYQAALKDLKKAQRERDKAFADIEAARLAEKRGDIKAHTELQARGIEALGTAKNRTVEGIAKIFDVDTRTATGIFETKLKENSMNERTMYTSAVDIGKQRMSDEARMRQQIESDKAALERTKIQANAPSGLERIYRDPALFKKHMEAQTASTGMRGDVAIRETWAKSPYLQAQYPNVEEYVRMMSGSSGGAGGDAFKVTGSRPAP